MTPLAAPDRTAERQCDAAAVAFAIALLTATIAAGAVVATRLTLDLLAWTGQAFWSFA